MIKNTPALKALLRGVILWAPVWIGASVVCGLLGGVYAFFLKKDVYLASQAILVRDEANATMMRLGRFESQTQLKAAQETIMEMARNRQVVRDAFAEAQLQVDGWLPFTSKVAVPSDRDLASFANSSISMHAPKGVEFGNTEVVYLDVKYDNKSDALKLVTALTNNLDKRLREVREARASSVIDELTTAKQAAQSELAATTAKIQAMEKQVGPQLGDLRGLTDTIGTTSSSRTQIDQIENELRQAIQQGQQLDADLALLQAALSDPAAYVLAPGNVLNAQPGLRKLREGLADAQLSTSQLVGKFTDKHPLVVAARDAQQSIERKLTNQLEASKIALVQDIETNKKRIAKLNEQKELAENRLDGLVDIRAQYANLVAELKTRSTILEETERQLSEAQASKQASQSVSLLTRLDEPQVSDRPIGPGGLTITLGGAIGGLLLGLGFVFAITPIEGEARFGRRWGDYMSASSRRHEESTTSVPTVEKSEADVSSQAEVTLPTIIERALERHIAPLNSRSSATSNSLTSGNTQTASSVRTNQPSANATPVNGLPLDSLLASSEEYNLLDDAASDQHPSEQETGLERKPKSLRSNAILEQLARVKDAFEDSLPEEAPPEADTVSFSRRADADKNLNVAEQEILSDRRARTRAEERLEQPIRAGVRPRKRDSQED